jgi:hypothetical protein
MTKETSKIELETSVKFIRLTNGDDIITEIQEENKTSMVIKNPMRLLIDADLEVGKQTIYMHTWMPQGIAKANTCILGKKDVIFIAELEKDLEEYYKTMVIEIFEDKLPALKADTKREYLDEDKKVLTFVKSNKDNKIN